MWQAIRSRKHPVPNSAVYSSKQGFRAGQIDGYRVLSRLMSDGTYLTFCPVRVAHHLDESVDCGRFVCGSKVDPKVELNHDDDTCSICLEAMDKPRQVIRARCGHLFHRNCWKQTSKKIQRRRRGSRNARKVESFIGIHCHRWLGCTTNCRHSWIQFGLSQCISVSHRPPTQS